MRQCMCVGGGGGGGRGGGSCEHRDGGSLQNNCVLVLCVRTGAIAQTHSKKLSCQLIYYTERTLPKGACTLDESIEMSA